MARIHTTSWLILAVLSATLASRAQRLPAVPAANSLVAPPGIQFVVLPGGANVQMAGVGIASLNLGHIAWAQNSRSWGVTHKKDKYSFTLTTSIGLRLDCGADNAGRLALVSVFLRESD